MLLLKKVTKWTLLVAVHSIHSQARDVVIHSNSKGLVFLLDPGVGGVQVLIDVHFVSSVRLHT